MAAIGGGIGGKDGNNGSVLRLDGYSRVVGSSSNKGVGYGYNREGGSDNNRGIWKLQQLKKMASGSLAIDVDDSNTTEVSYSR
ncbi:hypothetical protein B296_00055562 [Ensete ventricosum]|uniref:Uncharacterized protein n=1 Tax=Ensete ventricosum TaxID=4639 RepID=A0A426XZ90_ENSVE|nr:hypothetical protein B296_00055562 [Ensete ventricosum]